MASSKDAMAFGLSWLNRLASTELIDKFGLRRTTERLVYSGSKSGFATATKAGRVFTPKKGANDPVRLAAAKARGTFDITPTDDQQMMLDVVTEFADEVVRPAAEAADAASATPAGLLEQSGEFGVNLINLPESLGGLGEERSATTGVLVAEALARGDLGIAVSVLAPSAVSTAIALWGSGAQQQTYLPAFAGEDAPSASFCVVEPTPFFDPLALSTTAAARDDGFVLQGEKSAVIRGADAELFLIGADLDGEPRLFLVESGAEGLSVSEDPAMGLRAASLSRLHIDGVTVGADALVGTSENYREALRLARTAWAALAAGTGRAALDYVSEYVKTRQAFGEPIARRQSVAFMVSDIAIELEGVRLAAYKAAGLADQGRDIARASSLARELSGRYGMKIGTDAVQLLGGHGFVKEHPVERWYRDLRAVGVMEGGLLV